jgi:hypothetical protein
LTGELVTTLAEHTQRLELTVLDHYPKTFGADRDDSDRVGVQRIGLAVVAGVEEPPPNSQQRVLGVQAKRAAPRPSQGGGQTRATSIPDDNRKRPKTTKGVLGRLRRSDADHGRNRQIGGQRDSDVVVERTPVR